MTVCRPLVLILLFQSASCLAGVFDTSDEVFLRGGVCADDPFFIAQSSSTISNHKSKFDYSEFYNECKVLGSDLSNAYTAPTSFICQLGGKTVLSGATYKMIKEAIINDYGVVYIYECIKECSQSPKKIRYIPVLGGDCG